MSYVKLGNLDVKQQQTEKLVLLHVADNVLEIWRNHHIEIPLKEERILKDVEIRKMIETRKCIICKTGEFRCKTTTNRKTCCIACSRVHNDNLKKEWHKNNYTERREYFKKYQKAYRQKKRELGRVEK